MEDGLGTLSWRELLSTVAQEAMVVGKDYTVLHANSPMAERMGMPLSQITGKPCYELLHNAKTPCHERRVTCPVRQVMETGKPFTSVLRQTLAGGYRRYIEVKALPLRDSAGKEVSALYLVQEIGLAERYQRIFDTTKRKEAEKALALHSEALARSEARYRALFENAGDALVVVEDDTTISMVNRRFEEMTGYRKEEVEGKVSFLEFVPSEFRPAAMERHRQRRQSGDGTLPLYRIWGTVKDGIKRLAEVSGALIPGTSRTLIALRDITEAHLMQEELLRRNMELEAMHAVSDLVSASKDLSVTLQLVLDKVLEITGQLSGQLFLSEENQGKLFIRASSRTSERLLKGLQGMSIGEGITGGVAQTGEAQFIADLSQDPRLTRPVVLEEGIRSLACVPLVSRGRILGALSLGGREVREFPPGERHLLVSIGNEIGIALERAQLLQRAQDRASELESLIFVAREMASSLELQEVLDRTLAIMCREIGAERGVISVFNEESGELTSRAFWRSTDDVPPAPRRTWKLGEAITGLVAQQRKAMLCDDMSTDPRTKDRPSMLGGFRSVLSVPLEAKEKLLGVVTIMSRIIGVFTQAHLRLLTAYAAEASISLENALLHEEVKRQASTDELTQLANRRFFYQRLEEEMKRARRYRHPLSLLFIDVDDLKAVNDHYGHIQGDNLLRHLAAHIARVIRDTDVAARLGGDEFVVLLPVSSREEAASLAERLLREATPCPLETGGAIPLRMSIGIAWAPLDGSYDVDLLRLADEAVYRAKSKDLGWDFAMTEGWQAQFPLTEDPPEKPQEDATG